MGSLGIYFGPKEIAIVETSGKKVLNNIHIPQKVSVGGEFEDKAGAEAKSIELVSLISSELKKNNISSKQATLCLSGKDLIVRTFEMAQLPSAELGSAVDFEVKKYIPFKSDELKSDYQVEVDKVSHMNLVLFVGIKNEVLERYTSIFRQLNINIGAVEYAGFGILRAVKLAGLSEKGLKAVIVADVQAQDEVNFLVMEDGFPVFSRDINLAAGPAEASRGAEAGGSAVVEKLKTEIRVSLDYFRRKFPNRNVQEVIFAIDTYHRQEIESFISELGFPAKFLDIGKSIGMPVPYSSVFLKGFSASASAAVKIPVRVNLLKTKSKSAAFKLHKPAAATTSFLSSINPASIVIGGLMCVAALGYGVYLKQPLNKEIQEQVSQRVNVPGVNPESDYKDLANTKSQYQQKINNFVNLVDKQVFATEVLSMLPKSLPDGVWLEDFSFNNNQLDLNGRVYLSDENKQMDAANKFLANLKQDFKFSKYFNDIKLTSIDRGSEIGGAKTLKFAIICRSAQAQGRERIR